MGMKMSVEYIDSVYRIIQIVDESIIPAEKIKMFYGNMKQNMIVGISSQWAVAAVLWVLLKMPRLSVAILMVASDQMAGLAASLAMSEQ